MHIPTSMLGGQICPVTLTVGAVSVAAAAGVYFQSENKVAASRWAGVTALIFVLQMLNFPIASGTSGHVIGGVLAASLLGIPAGILSMALILAVQAVFFADGGINALGANVITMAVIGVGVGGLLLNALKAKHISQTTALAVAAFGSVILAALICTAQVAVSGTVAFGAMAKAMLPVHAVIGVGEGILTVVLGRVLSVVLATTDDRKAGLRLAVLCAGALALTPLASVAPDGLESVARNLGLAYSQSALLGSFTADYQFGARLVGVAVIWLFTWIVARRLAVV
ncbi:MAG: energy-coupling factor ABC transporter permease [Candidatus Omnitrophica bacterium]|nr:energy-coupling factor ABC transporter permease [Candidatus Omnitrophota bacterium]